MTDNANPEAIYKEAGVHFKLITSIKPSLLKLTKVDDEVKEVFRQIFPDLCVSKLNESSFIDNQDKYKSTQQNMDKDPSETIEKWEKFYRNFSKIHKKSLLKKILHF